MKFIWMKIKINKTKMIYNKIQQLMLRWKFQYIPGYKIN